MRIRVEQLNPTVGDLQGNKKLILEAIAAAESEHIDLLILPELVLLGYPPQDLLEREVFLQKAYEARDAIVAATGSTAVCFGAPVANTKKTGRKSHNAAVLARRGEVIDTIFKTLLPTYDVFDELRYFEPNDTFRCVELDGMKLGITVCEDIWYNANEIQYHTYSVNPVAELKSLGADCIVNISASPFTKHKSDNRLKMLQDHAREFEIPVFYANQAGANTELIFDGDSLVLDRKGELIARAELFKPDRADVDWDPEADTLMSVDSPICEPPSVEERMFRALVTGVRDYVDKTGIADKLILGLSGGIDSALVAVIASEAVGADKVLGVTMPSEYSSSGSVGDSELLARNLGIELQELPIKNIYRSFLDTLEPVFDDRPFNVAEENLQSRSRGVLLMGIANKFGYMLLNTGNKSEMAVGYCTLYGDMAGGIAVLSDVYKTEVYRLARWYNRSRGGEVIPQAIIDKEPSAELRPDQKDSDSLPSYDIMDRVLELYIEQQISREEILEKGFEAATVDRIIRLVDFNEYKRNQAPPGLKVSAKAFGLGRRWPIVQQWTGHEFNKSH